MEGKFIIDREIFGSDIWEKPTYYLKVWIWIIGKANWKKAEKGGNTFNRGEFKTDYREIIEANKWKIGWRTEKLKRDDIFSVLDFLRKTQRILTHKTTRGLWIKVLNYDYFQSFTKYEGNTERPTKATAEQQTANRDKRNNNETKMKEDVFSSFNKLELLEAYKNKKVLTHQPFFQGEEMRFYKGKMWVLPKSGGDWLEYAGKASEVEWRRK